MKKLMIILGVVLMGGTNALSANSITVDRAVQNSEVGSLPSFTSTPVSFIQTDAGNNPPVQNYTSNSVKFKANNQLMASGVEPDTRSGNPDNRGTTRGGTR